MDRRTFVFSATLGTLNLGLAGLPWRQDAPRKSLKIDVRAPEMPLSPLGMPGLFPGRVVEVVHSGAIVRKRVSQPAVGAMVEAGMKALTGEAAATNAWGRLFTSADIVAIKVNPSGVPQTTTSIALVRVRCAAALVALTAAAAKIRRAGHQRRVAVNGSIGHGMW